MDESIKELQYDAAGGLGSHVKAQANMLKEAKAYPEGLVCVPWNAGGKVLHPAHRVNEDDQESPRNKDFYSNLKAQAWWEFRNRVYRTHQMVTGIPMEPGGPLIKIEHDVDTLFSLPSKLPLFQKIRKELLQPVMTTGAKLKLVVDKAPEGTKSPNLADGIVMVYWPMPAVTGEFTDVGLMPAIFVGGEAFKYG